MKKKHYFFLPILMLLFMACNKPKSSNLVKPNQKETPVIYNKGVQILPNSKDDLVLINVPAQKTIEKQDLIIKSHKFIALETNENSLIGNIEKILSDSSFLFIFDYDNNSVLKFGSDGHFIKKIAKHGKGPGEYLKLSDIAIDKKNKLLSLLDFDGRKIILFDYNGNFVSEESMPFLFDSFFYLNDKLILNTGLLTNIATPKIDFYQLVVTNHKLMPVFKTFSYSKSLRGSEFLMAANNPLREYANKLYYHNLLSADTIWCIKDSSYYPAFVLNFKDGLRNKKNTENDVITYIMQKKEQSFIGNYAITTDFACFNIVNKNRYVFPLFYSKRTGNVLYGTISGLTNYKKSQPISLLNLLTDFVPQTVLNDTSFCRIWQPYILKNIYKNANKSISLNIKDKHFIEGVNEGDNPILLLYSLKNF